jgi:hypothetical protein
LASFSHTHLVTLLHVQGQQLVAIDDRVSLLRDVAEGLLGSKDDYEEVNKPEVDVDGELYEDDFDWDPR